MDIDDREIPSEAPPALKTPRAQTRFVLDAASLALLLFGETLSFWLMPGVVIWRLGPLFAVGLLLIALRHAVWPKPHLPGLIYEWIVAPAAADRAFVVTITLATRILVLLAGLASVLTFGYQLQVGQPRLSRNELLNLPARYDAGWYMGIARHGYEWREELRDRQQAINFFPAYPLMMRAAGDLVTVPAKVFNAPGFLDNGNTRVLWGGMLVSFTCMLIAACRIGNLAILETQNREQARWALALTLLWPYAFFLSGAYTEPLVLMTIAGALLSWKQERFRHLWCWGLLCGLARPNGWTLSIALLADLLVSKRKDSFPVAAGAAMSPVVGASVYSLYLFNLTGNPLEWVRSQQAWGLAFRPTAFVTDRWAEIDRTGWNSYVGSNGPDLVMLASVGVAVWATIWFVRSGEWLYAALIAAYLLPAVVTNTPSIGRMTAVLFPIALMLVQSTPQRVWPLLAIAFGMTQLWFAARHFIWLAPY